jgi:chondroitin AC lyase
LENKNSDTTEKKDGADLDIIRKRIIDDLLEPSVNNDEISKLVSSLKPDGTWPDINYVDVSRTGFQHSRHLQNMLEMSRAFKKPGSSLKENADLKKAISSALDFWISKDFICENWWWNEMGTPNLMINTLLVMDTDLTENQKKEGLRIANRANLRASGARPGGDLIQIAGMLGKQALFARNEAVLDTVVRTMASEIKITTGRGLQPDMSFHHRVDNVISTLTYGTGYASSFAYWAVKIAGTKYSLPDSATKLLIDYYIDGISQSMVYRMYPDPGAKNRDITRRGTLSAEGISLPQNLLKTSSYRSKELEEIIKVRKGQMKPDFTKDRFFWHSSYFTHQRPSYYISVRMHSSRANNMEEPHNEEGILNHHYGDGSNFISITGKEYVDIFPVWDWQKIPGTTVVQKPAIPNWKQLAKKGLTDFSGAVTDGVYSVAAFDFASVHDPLKAHKSWFFFDNEYVCLGAAINSEAEYPVFTTLNQCLLNKDVVVKTKDGESALTKGEHQLKQLSWISHDGVAYIFPSPVTVNVSNTTVTGNWRRTNHQAWATEEEVKKDVFTAWFDHGTKPKNSGYEYIVVPGIQKAAIEAYRKKAVISILSNTAEIQAVQHKGLKISQLIFYKPGKINISGDISINPESPCIIMVKTNGKKITKIAVADPTEKLKSLQFEISSRVEGSGKNWKAVWDDGKKASIISVELPTEGYAGQTVILEGIK